MAQAEQVTLTRRESDVLRLLLEGRSSYVELAEAMGVEVSTVRHHLDRLRSKMAVSTRSQIVAYAATHGMVPEGLTWRGDRVA